jgi:FeS assembly protein IscX
MQNKAAIGEVIDILSEDGGAMIPRPATEEDIAKCQEDLIGIGLEPPPQGYVDFLKINNGLAWNGIAFYSTYQITEADNSTSYRLMDLVSMNDDFNDRYELDEKVLLGNEDEEYYVYDIETKRYELLERESREAWQEFDTFEELFLYTVGGRLGMRDEGKAQYEHDEGIYHGEVGGTSQMEKKEKEVVNAAGFTWDDYDEIAQLLAKKFHDIDPVKLKKGDVIQKVKELDGFSCPEKPEMDIYETFITTRWIHHRAGRNPWYPTHIGDICP